MDADILRFLPPRVFLGLMLLAVLLLGPAAPLQAKSKFMVVTDDGNNLRAWGGQDYKKAPVLQVLNKGDYVRFFRKEEKWARVETADGLFGYVHVACLKEAPEVKPQALDPRLRNRLEDFLNRLQAGIDSKQFQQLAPLLDPEGVVIEHHLFKDAGRNPPNQSLAVVGLWYATDVSLTMGTAWELLMQGTNPPRVRLIYDKPADWWRVARPGEESREGGEVIPEKEPPVLPAHLKALGLASQVRFIEGDPVQLRFRPGPGPEPDYMADPHVTPFSWVGKVGPNKYKLMQLNLIGLLLTLTDRPKEGLRLKGVITQSP